ncbi:hypothetical protein P939_02629 [Mycobacterium tuberculosis KT-0045]|nr:hypothetical protein P939_02629 [Mycobacterium tuberculosis KT-0045]
MTYAARDDTTLPKLLAQMRWVVLVDKRQLAVLLLENEGPVASATDTLDTRGDSDYENQPVDAVVNRPGMSGDSSSWKGWGHVRWFIEEVPAGAA